VSIACGVARTTEPQADREPTQGEIVQSTATLTSIPSEMEPTSIPVRIISGTSEVTYHSDEIELQAFLCVPDGEGPFPAVVYNHGGVGDQVGGPVRDICEALADEGYVGLSPIRRATKSLDGHIDDVIAAVEYVMALEYVDQTHLGIMGFSRGGLLTLMAATLRDDFEAVVLMAPAPGGQNDFENTLANVDNVTAPVLILVSENDTEPNDLVRLSHMAKDALEAEGKQVALIMYPPYGDDGHYMFFEIGDYWSDVQLFLSENIVQE
ncbi:MAG: dienelactone hydrolase family protein, partial [Anaerolineales bacterium]